MSTNQDPFEDIIPEQKTGDFELLYIVSNKYTTEEVAKIQEDIKKTIEKHEGSVKKEVNYDKRRLAYPIKHNHYGYYILNQFSVAVSRVNQLNEIFRLHDDIVRHLITYSLPEGSVPTEADLKQQEPDGKKSKSASDYFDQSDKTTRDSKEEEKKEKAVPQKKPTIADIQATTEEQAKIKKGTAFDITKELGVTPKEAQESLEKEQEQEPQSTESVDMEGLEEKLDEIMKELD